MKPLKIALAGIGGFGAVHVSAVRQLEADGLAKAIAFAEPNANADGASKLQAQGLRAYTDYFQMLAQEPELDLVCIATPIHWHYPMAMAAFERGLHVFLEKPPVVRIQDLRHLITLAEQHGCFCAIGFHDIARANIITLKHRLCGGALGRISSVHAHCCWQRDSAYYSRSNWSGKTRFDGALILDGPMNNSCSHVLNMAAYLAGSEPYEFARPVQVQAELYRAGNIEGEDTNCLRASMENGAELCIHLTQCASENHARKWTVMGELGMAEFRDGGYIRLLDEELPCAEQDNLSCLLLRRLVEVVQGSDEPLLMPLAESEAFVLLSNGAYESARRIVPVPREFVAEVQTPTGVAWVIPGVDSLMAKAASNGQLLSECGIPWALATEPFDLQSYEVFPTRWSG